MKTPQDRQIKNIARKARVEYAKEKKMSLKEKLAKAMGTKRLELVGK